MRKEGDGWVCNRLGYVTFNWVGSDLFRMLGEADRHLSYQWHRRGAVTGCTLGWAGLAGRVEVLSSFFPVAVPDRL